MKKLLPISILLILLISLLAACAPATTATPAAVTESLPGVETETTQPSEGETAEPSATTDPTTGPTATLAPEAWRDLPIVPEGVSQAMIDLYRRGLAEGRDPNRFSKFGDCQSVPSLFLGTFDEGTYELGEEYAYLQDTIDHFAGSWSRTGAAVKPGMNVAAAQTLYYTDPVNCEPMESPMMCETRTYNASIVLISFETWSWQADKPVTAEDDTKTSYEVRFRSLLEYVLSQNMVPILSTKADNLEGDNGINRVLARLAYEYQVPIWNFWAAVQDLPLAGLSDGFHLTFAQNIFDDPFRMQSAWPWRNLTALQAIDAVYRALNNLP
jgi:hypothetical protein